MRGRVVAVVVDAVDAVNVVASLAELDLVGHFLASEALILPRLETATRAGER